MDYFFLKIMPNQSIYMYEVDLQPNNQLYIMW